MKKSNWTWTAVAAMGLALGGCTTLQGGKTILKYDSQTVQGPVQVKTPSEGSYGLFGTTDVQPIVRMTLNQGEEVGFRRTDQGRLEAFAGSQTFPLSAERGYYWKKL